MPLVESFTVDHTTMTAPQVRKGKVINRESGEVVEVYDLRFKKPNTTFMSTAGIHTLEHLLATYMREKLNDIIDISPMGCRTGFYMSIFDTHTETEIKNALIYTLHKVLETTEIPGAREIECGNYKDHSLEDAKNIATEVLEGLGNGD